MLRKDGTYTFYRIQHFQKGEKDEKWVYSDLGFFCKNFDFKVDPYRSFTAIGECWQEIGEYGCYDLSNSLQFLKQISESCPNSQFRLVKIHITQATNVEKEYMKKARWKVESKYETKEELYKFYKENGTDPEDFDIGEFNNVEISVIRENDKLGSKSYGWNSMDKIILFNDSNFNPEATNKDIEWCKQVAEAFCNALNEKEL